MNKLDKQIVNHNESLEVALKKLNLVTETQTLFVIDDKNRIISSVSDGDIRRGLIRGLKMSDPITSFANKKFSFIRHGNEDYSLIKEFRKRRLKAVPIIDKNDKIISIVNFSRTKSILPIDAVIMAGGIGSRLKPLTDKIPKPLLKIGDKEIISYNFDRLSQFGINSQYITLNYMSEKIISFCNNYKSDINFTFIKEKKFLGTAGSIALINEFTNDFILLMNSDVLTNIDYEDFYLSFIDSNCDMMVASIAYPVKLPYAIFNINKNQITSFTEKPVNTYYANAGIYLIKREVLKLIPKNVKYDATDLMNDVIKNNGIINHYPITSYWLDIGKHEDFKKAQEEISHIKF